jgi:inorganic pyrophosphatase
MSTDIQDRRLALRTIAERNASIPIPETLIAWAESTDCVTPHTQVIDNQIRVVHVVGRLEHAAREVREVAAMTMITRKRAEMKGCRVADATDAAFKSSIKQIEDAIALLQDQLKAITEDEFDAQDRRWVEKKQKESGL